MTMISKKAITITTIIFNNPSVHHTFNKLVINLSTIQINYTQNDACTWLNSRVEVGCMHHIEHDWLELWKSWWIVVKCMLYWLIIVHEHGTSYYFLANYGYLIIVGFFCNKLILAIFVPCGWYLWWSWTFVRGSKWTTVDYMEWDSFVGAAKLTWWHCAYFGRELCFVNQLLCSWFYNSFWIEDVNYKFNYMYELIYLPSCEWCVLN